MRRAVLRADRFSIPLDSAARVSRSTDVRVSCPIHNVDTVGLPRVMLPPPAVRELATRTNRGSASAGSGDKASRGAGISSTGAATPGRFLVAGRRSVLFMEMRTTAAAIGIEPCPGNGMAVDSRDGAGTQRGRAQAKEALLPQRRGDAEFGRGPREFAEGARFSNIAVRRDRSTRRRI